MEELIDEALRFLKSVVERANEVPEQNGLDVPTLLKLAWEKAEEELGPALRKEREAAARAKREAEEKAAIAEAAKKKVKAWTEKKEKDDQRAAEAAARAAAEREAKEEAARKKEEVAAAREMARRAQAAAKEAIEARKAEEAQRIADASEAAELARQHEEQATDAAAAADGFVVPTFSHAESANGPPPRSDENQLMGEQPMEELEKSKVGTGEVVATPASRAVHVTVGTVPSDVANKQVKRKSAEDEAEEEASAQHELGRQAKPTSSASSAAAARLERSHRRLSAFNMLPRFGKSGSEAQHSEQGDADGSQLVEAPEQAKERPKRPTLLDWLPDPHRTQARTHNSSC